MSMERRVIQLRMGKNFENNTLPELFDRLHAKCDYAERRKRIQEHNSADPLCYRGLSLTSVKIWYLIYLSIFESRKCSG